MPAPVFLCLVQSQCAAPWKRETSSSPVDMDRSNGEKIYVIGMSKHTGQIESQGGPLWLRTHGGGCIACHGPDGQGGISSADSAVPANIRYSSLTADKHGNGKSYNGHEHYGDSLIKRAITMGIDAGGKSQHWSLPRWKMSEEDLNDISEYLKSLL